MSPKRGLLLCFDAFGTLFFPKAPIAALYGEVARRHGITAFTEEALHGSFRYAFKKAVKENPNYGKAVGMGATQWWRDVMRDSFSPFHNSNQKIPQELYSDLLTRFSTKEGYTMYPDVLPFFSMLREIKTQRTQEKLWNWDTTIVGVITNSDDRVPGVLESFGLEIGPRRGTSDAKSFSVDDDVNFVVLSYDIGFEKPHPQIFDAAKQLLQDIMADKNGSQSCSPSDFETLYVGDDLEKDYFGARAAGWNAIYLDRQDRYRRELPEVDSIATVALSDDHAGHARTVRVIRDLWALCNWKPR